MIWKFQSVAKTPIGPAQNVDGPHTAGVARTRNIRAYPAKNTPSDKNTPPLKKSTDF